VCGCGQKGEGLSEQNTQHPNPELGVTEHPNPELGVTEHPNPQLGVTEHPNPQLGVIKHPNPELRATRMFAYNNVMTMAATVTLWQKAFVERLASLQVILLRFLCVEMYILPVGAYITTVRCTVTTSAHADIPTHL
jgi:hypothetical protein